MFSLDTTQAKILLRKHVQDCEYGTPLPSDFDQIELEEWLEAINLDYFHDDHARSVDEILYLILEGGESGDGALIGGEGYRITSYPLGFTDSCDVLITLRRRGGNANEPYVQIADASADEVRHLYDTDHGVDLVLEICQSVILTANRLLPALQALNGWHQRQMQDVAEGH